MRGEIIGFFILSERIKKKESSTVLCSAVKHAGSGRARKFRALPLRACFTAEQSTVEDSLFVA